MMIKKLAGVVVLTLFFSWPLVALAQQEPPTPTPVATEAAAEPIPTLAATPTLSPTITPTVIPPEPTRPPTHTILSGETLVTIAEQYSVTVEALQLVNDINDPELIFADQVILIPGELGDELPTAYVVQLGDTLNSIAGRFNTTAADIAQANRLPTAEFIYAGQRLSFLSRTGTPNPLPLNGRPISVNPGETIWEIALAAGVTVADLRELNDLAEGEPLYPGQRLRLPGAEVPFDGGLPGGWQTLVLEPAALTQGDTAVLSLVHTQGGTPDGMLIDPAGVETPLRFFQKADDGPFYALLGFDAFATPGRYTVRLGGVGPARPWFPIERSFAIGDVDYGFQQIELGEGFEALLDPEIRAAEDAILNDIFVASDPVPLWDGIFQQPVSNTFITAGYGSDRSYNGGPVTVFHSGIDFGGIVGTPIVAPAAGRVVFADSTELRGNILILDHGGGVMTAYYHLSSIAVAVGDEVTAGQQVAAGGNTGLSTGPHLHWDVRVWGAAVNPEQWLNSLFP